MYKNLRFGIYLFAALTLHSANAYSCELDELLSQSYQVKGIATDHQGKALYTEYLTYLPEDRGGTLNVQYQSPDGNALASKEVQYNCNATAPTFVLTDLLTGSFEGVGWNGDSLETFKGNQTKTVVAPDSPFIVDAGFDNAIKINWDLLLGGQSVDYRYLLARKGKFFNLRFNRSEAPKIFSEEASDNIVFFRIFSSNLFLNLLSSPIYVGYRVSDRSLAYYLGPTNLPMISSENSVAIRYSTIEDHQTHATNENPNYNHPDSENI